MYVFANMGYYLFGYGSTPGSLTYKNWGTLGGAMYTLQVFVTVDGWLDLQKETESENVALFSRFFTIIFIFVGHFIFTNLFIGVVIQVCIYIYTAL